MKIIIGTVVQFRKWNKKPRVKNNFLSIHDIKNQFDWRDTCFQDYILLVV